MIYDNVKSADVLAPYWPKSDYCNAIVTTRNYSIASDTASDRLEVTTMDQATGSEFLFFLLKKEISKDVNQEKHFAKELAQKLSGHTLSLSHVAGLIYNQSWSISEFMSDYLKSAALSHQTELDAIWEFSFKSLDANSLTLLGILAFLMPDKIPQSMLMVDSDRELPKELSFCRDESELVYPL